jgi:hypothetical protein
MRRWRFDDEKYLLRQRFGHGLQVSGPRGLDVVVLQEPGISEPLTCSDAQALRLDGTVMALWEAKTASMAVRERARLSGITCV